MAADLWAENGDLAAAALSHPFVRGVADGSLPRQTFTDFIAQDTFFLEAFARAYALALAHSPDRDTLEAFADLIAGVMDELKLHASYSGELGIDASALEPTAATSAYTGFLLATAAGGDVAQTCAAMTPCMRLYAYLGSSLAATHTETRYAEWIKTYADPEFEGLAVRLEALLDRQAADLDAVRAPYRRAMELELRFFDGALWLN